MPQINEAEYKSLFRSGNGGVYVFFGEEDYLIAHYRDKLREPYLTDAAMSFDYLKIAYSDEDDAKLIVSTAMSPSMMSLSGKKLIEVNVENFDSLSSDVREALFEALDSASEYDDSIVVVTLFSGTFDYGMLPKRPSTVAKRLFALGNVKSVYFPESTPAQLRRWIERHFERAGLTFDYDVSDRILFIAGRKMTVLAEEINKVIAYVKSHGTSKVTLSDVVEVCSAADRYDAFELSDAILNCRREDALTALRAEQKRRTDPIMLLGSIMKTISDMLTVKIMMKRGQSASEISSKLGIHEYKVKLTMKSVEMREISEIEEAVEACAEADSKLKSSKLGYIALERLVVSIGVKK